MENTYMKDKERDLQGALKEGEERVKGVVSDIDNKIKQGQEQMQKVMGEVDKKLRDNPWPIVGGVAIGCVLLGFILGLSKRN
jgi:ElaB/YqjD/DUF883 family membrane-anchored ribosome-binding protein